MIFSTHIPRAETKAADLSGVSRSSESGTCKRFCSPVTLYTFHFFPTDFSKFEKKEDWASDQIELHEAMKSQSCHFSVLVWWKVQSGLSRFYRLLPLWQNFGSWRIWEQTKSHLCSVSKHWFHLHPLPHPHLHPETTDYKVSSEYLSVAPEEVFPMHKKPQPLPIQRSGLPPCLQRPAPCKGYSIKQTWYLSQPSQPLVIKLSN